MFERLKSIFRRQTEPVAPPPTADAAKDAEPVTVFIQGAECKVRWSAKLNCLTVGKPMWDGTSDENNRPVFKMHYEPFSVEECLAFGITHVTAAMAGAPEGFVDRMRLASKS